MYNINVAMLHGTFAGMAELADALDSGSSESNFMEVQVLLPAPKNSENFVLGIFLSKPQAWYIITT